MSLAESITLAKKLRQCIIFAVTYCHRQFLTKAAGYTLGGAVAIGAAVAVRAAFSQTPLGAARDVVHVQSITTLDGADICLFPS